MCDVRLLRAGWRKQIKLDFYDMCRFSLSVISGQSTDLREYACRLMRARSYYTLLIQIDTNRTLLEFMCEIVYASLESDIPVDRKF